MHALPIARLTFLAIAAICPATAQTPANDDCSAPIAVAAGANGPFQTAGATAVTAFPCVAGGGGADVWFRYIPATSGLVTARTCGADFDTCIEVLSGTCASLTSIACNDDACDLQSSVAFPATGGTAYLIRVGGWNDATGSFPLEIVHEYGVDLIGVAETVFGTGSMTPVGSAFTGGDTLRFNYRDPTGISAGRFSIAVMNIANGGPAAIGVTPAMPGFDMLWAGSTPTGQALLFPAVLLPAGDQFVTVPNGIFHAADTVRLQGVIYDPLTSPAPVPLVPTGNTVQFVAVGAAVHAEGFEGWTAGGPPYGNGWSDGGGTQPWHVHGNSTSSPGTGPSAAYSGNNYLYCETSFPAGPGTTWIVDSPVYASTGLTAVGFALSRVGDAIGTLEVLRGDGSGTFPVVLATYSGAAAAEWTEEIVALGTAPPANLQLRFRYSYGGGYRGDLAIDDFTLQ